MTNTKKAKHIESEPEHYLFSSGSEPFLERLLFAARPAVLMILALLTVVFGYGLTQIKLDSSIEKYIPLEHEFIQNYLVHKDELSSGLSNIKISVESNSGDIFNKEYMETLQRINDEIFFIKGVDRSAMKSLWTPNVRWMEVTEQGFQGGPVIPPTYDGSQESLELLRQNVLKSGQVGRLVANNFSSTIIDIPLIEVNPDTGEKLDYQDFSRSVETNIVMKLLFT
jgi:predicted RND superfamily exporter protein